MILQYFIFPHYLCVLHLLTFSNKKNKFKYIYLIYCTADNRAFCCLPKNPSLSSFLLPSRKNYKVLLSTLLHRSPWLKECWCHYQPKSWSHFEWSQSCNPIPLPRVGLSQQCDTILMRGSLLGWGPLGKPSLLSRLTEIDILSLDSAVSRYCAQNCYRHHAVGLKTRLTHKGEWNRINDREAEPESQQSAPGTFPTNRLLVKRSNDPRIF